MDNAATTWPKPQQVYRAIDRCSREICANPGRGSHDMAIESATIILRARQQVAAFFNAPDPMKVIFTKNCTEALNLGIKGYLKEGDHVITSQMEHNSVIRPLNRLIKQKGISVTRVGNAGTGLVVPLNIEKAINKRTKLIVITLSSNVTGLIMPIEEIGQIAKRRKITFMIDAAQGSGVIKIDMNNMGIDMIAFPGHKGLMGPQGTGGLIMSKDFKLDPLLQGGTGSMSRNADQPIILPESLESGTLNMPGIAGIESGIKFIDTIGIDNIQKKKTLMISTLSHDLNGLKGLTIYSNQKPGMNSGIFSFNINGLEAEEVAYILNEKYQIAVRAGLHCAPSAHQILGTINTGCVRVSPGYFSTLDEIRQVIRAIRDISFM